jgi:1-acyl-sn-glycerol-3-phosphate acyltransferase
MISIFIRSAAFNAGFYLSLLVHMVLAIPSFFLPRQVLFMLAKSWARSMTWMLRVFCNISVEYRGLEKIPKGPLLVAAKHQSAFETIALLPLFREPLFILKPR